jgi:signal transduction histidine kinase
MSESYGSILELSKATVPNKVNLLIITDSIDNSQTITAVLSSADIDFTYELVIGDRVTKNLPQKTYSAILYDYVKFAGHDTNEFLIKKLQWWCQFFSHIPLILITDPLGDRRAVELIQSGVSGYILRNKLHQLPNALEKSLLNFGSSQGIIRRQQNQIEQQRQQIQQLQDEIQTWIDDEQNKQEHFAYLSHELRSPVSSVLGFARMLKAQYYGDLNSKQMQYVNEMVKVGEYMLELVNNYLDLAKINANKQTLDLQKLPVEEICQSSISKLQEKAIEKGLELNLNLENGIDFCIVDPVRIQQILINLLSNAIKFTARGRVTLQVILNGDTLCFSVMDTGEGISADNMTKLFKPFPQISSSYESTGLGLTLSKQLARLHGGDITVTSELGKGSCFTLELPLHQPRNTIVE